MFEVTDTSSLERHIRATIPIARSMEIKVADYDGNRLALVAPLAPNVNDKGCAFGGSIASLLTLAGWGLICLKLAEQGLDADVFVQDTSLVFASPIWDELVAEAYAPDNPWDAFVESLRTRGRARITIEAEVAQADGGLIAAKQSARFVAKLTGGNA